MPERTLLLLFDRLPAWMPGCYGGVPTPAFDSLAARGTVHDFAFVTTPPAVGETAFEVRRHPGVPADLAAADLREPGRLNESVEEADWSELLELWSEDGFEFDAADLQPADLPDLLAETPELLSDDLRYESDEAARVAAAVERLALLDADDWLGDQLDADCAVAVTALTGGTPLPRPDETLLDTARHVPLIVSAGRPSRCGDLIDASRFLADGVLEPSAELRWCDAAGEALRTPTHLNLRETTGDGVFVRRFAKPDDRFCQLNIARPGETELNG